MKGHDLLFLDIDRLCGCIIKSVVIFFHVVGKVRIVITESSYCIIGNVHLQFYIVYRKTTSRLLCESTFPDPIEFLSGKRSAENQKECRYYECMLHEGKIMVLAGRTE